MFTYNRKVRYERLKSTTTALAPEDVQFMQQYEHYIMKKRRQSRNRDLSLKDTMTQILQKKEYERTPEECHFLEQCILRKNEKNEKDRIRQRRLRSSYSNNSSNRNKKSSGSGSTNTESATVQVDHTTAGAATLPTASTTTMAAAVTIREESY